MTHVSWRRQDRGASTKRINYKRRHRASRIHDRYKHGYVGRQGIFKGEEISGCVKGAKQNNLSPRRYENKLKCNHLFYGQRFRTSDHHRRSNLPTFSMLVVK